MAGFTFTLAFIIHVLWKSLSSNEIPHMLKIRCISETIYVGRYQSPPTDEASSKCSQQCEALCDCHSPRMASLHSLPVLFFSFSFSLRLNRRSAAQSRTAIDVHSPGLCWSHCLLLLVFPFPYVYLDDFFSLQPGCWHHRHFTPEIRVDRKTPIQLRIQLRPPRCSTKS